MSYHVVFVTTEHEPPTDGPAIASNWGYYEFGSFVEQRAQEFPELAHLVEHGFIDENVPGSLAKLAAELPRLETAAAALPDVASVARSLAAALAQAPAGTTGVLVTDGEPAGEEPLQSNVYG